MNFRLHKHIWTALMPVLLVFGSGEASAKTFNTIDAVESSMNIDCIDYCIVGICVHLKCGMFGCKLTTSPRVSHYLPDLIVSVYDEVEEQPWEDYKPIQEALLSTLSNQGSGLMQGEELDSQQMRFKNSSAVGHPFLLFSGQYMRSPGIMGVSGSVRFPQDNPDTELIDESWTDEQKQKAIDRLVTSKKTQALNQMFSNANFKGFCPSKTEPLKPYYDSTLDFFEWRYAFIDRLKSIQHGYHLLGRREIGSRSSNRILNTNTWGAVWPRFGFVLQQEDPKAAAIIAQRTADIVTRNDGWRIHSYAGPPASNEKNDHWQMISPKEDQVCKPFGSKQGDWSEGRNPDGEGQYGWNYWRKYTCCMGSGRVVQIVPLRICLKDIFK